MRTKFLLTIGLILSISQLSVSQSSKVYDNLTLNSEILKSERKYAIYLPADYESSSRSYPVLYLLHGIADDHTGWLQFGEVQWIADKAIKDGIATSMVIVMPDAQTGRRGFFNEDDGDWQYEDFFIEEFIPYIEKTYRIKSEKQFRAVSGLGTGGDGAFVYALHHPEMFSSSCPLTATMDSLPMIDTISDKDLKSVKWFIDCADDDFLFEGNSLAHIALRKRGIPHEYRVREGRHNWTYWRESLPFVLEFISETFHR